MYVPTATFPDLVVDARHQLRTRFKTHSSCVEKVKKEATKLQDDTRAYVKCYKNLGDELGTSIPCPFIRDNSASSNAGSDGVFSIHNEEHGKRYKNWAVALDTSAQELMVRSIRFFLLQASLTGRRCLFRRASARSSRAQRC